MTDDKSLPKEERKKLQVARAGSSSRSAKLVKLADKLYNLRDLDRTIPEGWTADRATKYFHWAAQVVDGCRGTNDFLERELDRLFIKWKVLSK